MKEKAAQQTKNTQTREAWLSADNEETVPEKMMDEIETDEKSLNRRVRNRTTNLQAATS